MPQNTFPKPGKKESEKTGHKRPHEVDELMKFLQEYGWPVGIGVVLALVIVLGYAGYTYYQQAQKAQAAHLLVQAAAAEDLEHVLSQYGDTPVAPMARLGLASARFRNAQYEQAHRHYMRFLEQYPDHDMVPDARIGIAYTLEAMGRIDDAYEAFLRFAETHPDHYMAPLAAFGTARCLSLKGQHEEAIDLYERFIEENPESPWLPQAETARIYTEKIKRAAQ